MSKPTVTTATVASAAAITGLQLSGDPITDIVIVAVWAVGGLIHWILGRRRRRQQEGKS